MVPVAGTVPQLLVEDEGGADLQIAGLAVQLPPVAFQGIAKGHTLGQEHRESGAFLKDVEELQLFAQFAVIPLFGLFQHLQVLFQHRSLGEADAVHPAQHPVVGVAAPIGAGALGQLDGLDGAGIHQVGAGAQVGEIALAEEAQLLPFSSVLLDQFDLVGVILHQLFGLVARELKPLQCFPFLDDLLHFGFDLLQVFCHKGLLHVDVIIEAVVHRGADGQFSLGIQVLHRLGQHMGAGVPECLFALGVLKGEDGHIGVAFDGEAQVPKLAVHFCSAGGFGQAGREVFCDLNRGNRSLVLLGDAVF